MKNEKIEKKLDFEALDLMLTTVGYNRCGFDHGRFVTDRNLYVVRLPEDTKKKDVFDGLVDLGLAVRDGSFEAPMYAYRLNEAGIGILSRLIRAEIVV